MWNNRPIAGIIEVDSDLHNNGSQKDVLKSYGMNLHILCN